jgi:glycosyltransferase involved in cell wall biosynthesis
MNEDSILMNRVRILLDLTTSYKWKNRNAVGIVRTEREIAIRLLKEHTLSVVPVLFFAGEFHEISREEAFAITANPSIEVIIACKPKRNSATIKFIISRIAKKTLPKGLVSRIKNIRRLKKDAIQKPELPSELASISHVLEPQKNDILFTCGLGWEVFNFELLSIIKEKFCIKIVTVIYDLIPVLFPEMMGDDYRKIFLNYFTNMADLNNFVFCISQSTAKDFLDFCTMQGKKAPKTKVIVLGSNALAVADDREIRAAGTFERHKEVKFALSVGTFEIRKNYELLFNAWTDLCTDDKFEMDLVIVGMPGWRNDNVIKQLRCSKLYNRRIFWYERLSDSGLSWLYETCQVFVYPSLYEGWGLPVVEALIHNKPAVISNRGAVPEAGMGLCTVVDPNKYDEWKRVLREYSQREKEKKQYSITFPSWDDTTKIIVGELLNTTD